MIFPSFFTYPTLAAYQFILNSSNFIFITCFYGLLHVFSYKCSIKLKFPCFSNFGIHQFFVLYIPIYEISKLRNSCFCIVALISKNQEYKFNCGPSIAIFPKFRWLPKFGAYTLLVLNRLVKSISIISFASLDCV